MERLRDLLRSLEGQPVLPSARPTSLYEAGRVGASSSARPTRSGLPRDASIDSATDPTAEERTGRRERTASSRRPIAPEPEATTLVARQILAALRDPESLRTAILLREVLDPPVSRRPRTGARR